MNQHNKHWGIIGGGILGMYLALRLSEEGEKVTLFEAKENLGGLAGSWQLGDISWDKFYHVILLSDSRLRRLLEQLGLEKELNWVETKTGFYTEGKLYSMSNTFEFLQFPPLSMLDKLRLGMTIYYASRISNWKALENISVSDWLTKMSGKNTFEKIWLPLLRAKLGTHYQHTSATFIWTTIQRMYKARRTGLKKEMFGYVNGGYNTVIEELKKKLLSNGVEIKTGHRINSIEADQAGLVKVSNDQKQAFYLDEVIATIPSSVAVKICKGLSPEEIRKHRNIEYIGAICASVLMKKSLSPYYVTNITDQTPFTGIIEMTNIVHKDVFNGNNLIYLPRYLKTSNPIFHWKDHQIELLFTNALLNMYPKLRADDIVQLKVSRAPFVFALPTLNYSQELPPVSSSIPGVHLLNSAHIVNGTLNVNETLQLADTALPGIIEKTIKRKLHHEQTLQT